MKVRVLFFGGVAETVGTREVEFELSDDAKAKTAFEKIVERFPALRLHKLLFAVNQEYADGAETIRDGDELAVFTHVSGG